MPELFRFSRQAEMDLVEIGTYTIQTWGEAQADRYLSQLETCCARLAKNPNVGRACDDIRPGLRRFEHGKHVVFYRKYAREILVVRILHQRMLPERQQFDETT